MSEQFLELIELLLAIKLTVDNIRDQFILALQIITGNWGLPVVKRMKLEIKSNMSMRQITFVSSIYKSNYKDA